MHLATGRWFSEGSKIHPPRIQVTDRVRRTFRFLLDFWAEHGGKTRLFDMDWDRGPTCKIYCDAAVEAVLGPDGGVGCGAFCLEIDSFYAWKPPQEVVALGSQHECPKTNSSPYFELYNMALAVCTMAPRLAGHRVLVIGDCVSMVKIMNHRYSEKPYLQVIIECMWRTVASGGFSVRFQHHARTTAMGRIHCREEWWMLFCRLEEKGFRTLLQSSLCHSRSGRFETGRRSHCGNIV